MICPACDNVLTETEAGGVVVDACSGGCGGIWFDNFELEKMDEPDEMPGEVLLDIPRDESVRVDLEERRDCPRCDDMVLGRHFMSVKMEVTVDECPNCAGHWIDFGELARIRDQFWSEDERKAAANGYFDEIFGEKLEEMGAESQENLEKAHRIARMFRFICPSYYLPGKQRWGAF
jgi:Zn-finger nucleic acid-binding protein